MTTREQYVHRLGRTARAGKEGSGLLLCAPYELAALKGDLKDMPLVTAEPPELSGPAAEARSRGAAFAAAQADPAMRESAEQVGAYLSSPCLALV